MTEKEEQRTDTGIYPKDGVSCSADSFVVAENFVLRINIIGKDPAHRKSAFQEKNKFFNTYF